MLRILHPFMPFISEELWQALRPYLSEAPLTAHLAIARWPQPMPAVESSEVKPMSHAIEATEVINSLRAVLGYHPGQRVSANIIPHEGVDSNGFDSWRNYVVTLGKVEHLKILPSSTSTRPRGAYGLTSWAEIGVEAPEGFDFDKARGAIRKKLDEVRTHLARNQGRFDNPGFRAKADAETVAEIAEKIEELKMQQRTLEGQLEQLR
jgi:valyl-tRNA synthetase